MDWIRLIILLITVLREIRNMRSDDADKAFKDAGFVRQGNLWCKTVVFKRRRSKDIIYDPDMDNWSIEQEGSIMQIGTLDDLEKYVKRQKDR